MASGFPLYVDLHGNNCTVFGGGPSALRRVRELLHFGAKVTVISPELCDELKAMSSRHEFRYLPRKYYRGDCTNSQLCVAATDNPALNISISTECKAKAIPVNVTNPAVYGNFHFPRTILQGDLAIAVGGNLPSEQLRSLRDQILAALPDMLRRAAQTPPTSPPDEDGEDPDEELFAE